MFQAFQYMDKNLTGYIRTDDARQLLHMTGQFTPNRLVRVSSQVSRIHAALHFVQPIMVCRTYVRGVHFLQFDEQGKLLVPFLLTCFKLLPTFFGTPGELKRTAE